MIAHLIACTVAAGLALAAAQALGHGPARWRYALLLAALLRFAMPTAWLDAGGRGMRPLLPAPARTSQAVDDLRRLLVHPGPLAPESGAPARRDMPPVLLLLWTAGTAACLWSWARQLRLRPTALRHPDAGENEAFANARRALGVGRPVELRIVSPQWIPGAMGYRHPVVVLPDGLSAQLTPAELEAVLAHEVAHVLRRDNWWAAAAHAVVAAFWFHPLVWWIERRLLAEREAACDELVLGRGATPETYLSGILKVCRTAFAGPAGYAGANGSNLENRMERIMSANIPHASRWERAAAGALMAMAALFPLAGGYLNAQPQRQTAAQPPTDDQVQASRLYDQGVALLNQKDYDEALRTFRRSYEVNPGDIRSLNGMVEVEFALGRQDEGLALLAQESARRPNRRDLQLSLGNAAVRASRYEMGIEVFQKLIDEIGPNSWNSADLYLRMGETYRRMKDYPQAIAALRRADDLKPNVPVVRDTLALILDAAGQTNEAEIAYRKVLETDPNNLVARNNLAYSLAAHGGNLDEALQLARDAQLFYPTMAEVSDTLGYVYLVRKESGQAFQAFRDAVQQDLTNRTYRKHLLDALDQMSEPPANAAALQQALRADPTASNQEAVRKLLQ